MAWNAEDILKYRLAWKSNMYASARCNQLRPIISKAKEQVLACILGR